MKFGPIPVDQAIGAVLAHSIEAAERPYEMQLSYRIRKGTVLTAGHIADLKAEDVTSVVAAQLEDGDTGEDHAAAQLAEALVGANSGVYLSKAATGRVNVFAAHAGVAIIDADRVNAFNAINPMITVATVPEHQRMDADGMIATIKIIAYAVPQADVDAAAAIGPALGIAAPQYVSATLIETAHDMRTQPSDKGRRVMAGRLARLGMQLTERVVVAHRATDLSAAINGAVGEIILILTASATSDPCDVAPQAVLAAGGTITRFGMPVDPGNLLFLGALGPKPIIGLPGCARSPVLNGADWVLERVVCGITIGADDIAAMGVGGLLKEIPTRPSPRNAGK